jgi:hypothetical protein
MNFLESFNSWRERRTRFGKSRERERRRAICAACEFHSDSRIGIWCKKCRCDMELKTSVMSAHCPLNPPKWGPF